MMQIQVIINKIFVDTTGSSS
ncbi:hypothetical protein MTR67_044413 [Solanum verrucosum]|uniref:Uncharacterized protein n=1 Tax=Solanum verrucosum TaxID=315347 RepID=A0AAF0UTD5_SOLVR|nr:hypothetical protein MTR67_044413 [Solanum verrucosum]